MIYGAATDRRPVMVTFKKDFVPFRVKPGFLRVSRKFGESPEIVLINDTVFPVEFRFPDDLMLDPKTGKCVTSAPLTPKGTASATMELDVNDKYKGGNTTEPYDVCVFVVPNYCIDASGGSRPEVDIKP